MAAFQTIHNQDGTVTLRDPTTGMQQIAKPNGQGGYTILSRNYGGATPGISVHPSQSAINKGISTGGYIPNSGPLHDVALNNAYHSSGGQGPYHVPQASVDAVRGTGDLLKTVLGTTAPAAPTIDWSAAQQQALAALKPLIASQQQALDKTYGNNLNVLQAQQAMAGLTGSDVAAQQLRKLATQHGQAVNDLTNSAGANAAQQALQLIQAQQNRYQNQQAANTALQQLATNLFGLQEQGREANLPYQFAPVSDVLSQRGANYRAALPYNNAQIGSLLDFLLNAWQTSGGNTASLQQFLQQLGLA